MSNMTDYLRWRGDLSFAERPFNPVDNLVLATLSYVDFSGIVPNEEDGGSVRLAEATNSLLAQANGNVKPFIRSLAQVDEPFLVALAESRRFGDAQLRAHADTRATDTSGQFSAITIDLPDTPSYVSFRGTDSTLVGWKENFMLTFKVSPAQVAAAHYLRSRLSEGGELQVGGHSKGGNLAAFAALSTSGGELARITRVWSNDGPGMAAEIMPEGGFERLGDRLVRIVPTFSFVGMFFNDPALPYRVVKSSGEGAYQHDPLSWQVTRDSFDWAEDGLDPDCAVVNDTLRDWLASIPLDEREQFTNELFSALEESGAVELSDVAHVGMSSLGTIATKLAKQDKSMHDLWKRLAGLAASNLAAGAREKASSKLADLKESASELVRREEGA